MSQRTVDTLQIQSTPKFILPNRAVVFAVNETAFDSSSNPHDVWYVSDTTVRIEPIQIGSMRCNFSHNGRFRIHLNVYDSLTHQLLSTADSTVLVGFPTDLAIVSNPAHPHVGDSILFSLAGHDMTSFRLEWNLGDSIFQTTRSNEFATRSFEGAGDYAISVRIIDSIGRVDSISETLHISPVGGELSMAFLRQFNNVEVNLIGVAVYPGSPLVWNGDTGIYSTSSHSVDSSSGLRTESSSSSIFVTVSEQAQSLSVYANRVYSWHYNFNYNYDYIDVSSYLSCYDVRATLVSKDSICFIATGLPLLKRLRYVYSGDQRQRTQPEQSRYEDEKTVFGSGRIPTLKVVFRK